MKVVPALMAICLLLLLSHSVSAQSKVIGRLYLPLTSNTTLVKEGRDTNLLVKDYLGSTRTVSSRGSISDQDYLPYGERSNKLQETSKSQTSNFNKQITDRTFTGHRSLDDSPIIHMAARFYNPQTGTFIQPDIVEGPNRFAYVAGNPISKNDPTGHDARIVTFQTSYLGVRHVGAVLEDKNNVWHYFYWGAAYKSKIFNAEPKIVVQTVPTVYKKDGKELRPLEKLADFNAWAAQYHDNYPKYDESIYIPGDFDKSVAYVKELSEKVQNKVAKYDLFSNNCMQVTCDILMKGASTFEEMATKGEENREDLFLAANRNLVNPNLVIGNFVEKYQNKSFTETREIMVLKTLESLVKSATGNKKEKESKIVPEKKDRQGPI